MDDPLPYALFRFPKSSATTLVNVTAKKNNGELISVDKAELTMKGKSSFYHNVIDGERGATIVVSESTVHLSGVLFRSNVYKQYGSCLSLIQESNGTVDDVQFVDNEVWGSCISASASNIHLRGVLFRSNEYRMTGSGFSLHQGYGRVDDVRFADNKVWGSCILAVRFEELQIHSSIFEENHVNRGSVVRVKGTLDDGSPILNISHTSFTKNVGCLSDDTSVFGIQLHISRFDRGRVSLHSTTFLLNVHEECIAGIVYRGGNLLLVSSQDVDFTVTNCTFHANQLTYLSEMFFETSSGNFFISKSKFSENVGNGTGGVIFFASSEGSDKLRIADSVFRGNSGHRRNVCIIGAESVHLERCNFTENSVEADGAALYVTDTNSLESNDCWIANNYVGLSSDTLGNGGAFHFHEVSSVRLQRSVFHNNSASPQNGGVGAAVRFVSNGLFLSRISVGLCKFQKNKANYAGGLFVSGFLTVTIWESTFIENSAGDLGGAVFVAEGNYYGQNVEITGSSFTDNSARIGGAICSRYTKTFIFSNCSFVRNNATLYGGAIALLRMPEPTAHINRQQFGVLSFVENSAAYGGLKALVCQLMTTMFCFSGALFMDNSKSSTEPDKNYLVMPTNATRGAPGLHGNGNLPFSGKTVNDPGVRFSPDVTYVIELIGKLKFSGNHAETAGGAIFAQDSRYPELLDLKCTPPLNASAGGIEKEISSLRTIECGEMEGNTVKDGGYGPDIATPSIGFFATLLFKNGTNHSLAEGDSCDLGDWKSGDELPLLQVVMYDSFGQGMARTRSPAAEVITILGVQTPVGSYGFPVTALVHSTDKLFQNGLVGDLTNGKGNIVLGSPLVEPGDYSADLSIQRDKERNITFTVTARNCVINEYPREDNKECLVCDPRHYNFDPMNGNCTICPKDADCTKQYVVPEPGNWNAFPCSHKIHRCLHEDACLGMDITCEDCEKALHVDENKTGTCDFSDQAIAKYQRAMCKDGYEGVLCGTCKATHAKIGLSTCRRCRHHFLSVLAIAAAMVLLTYSSTEQIGGNLENVRSRWMRRMESLRTMRTEAAIREAMNRAEADQEHVEVAQKAKERFVLVLQVWIRSPSDSQTPSLHCRSC